MMMFGWRGSSFAPGLRMILDAIHELMAAAIRWWIFRR